MQSGLPGDDGAGGGLQVLEAGEDVRCELVVLERDLAELPEVVHQLLGVRVERGQVPVHVDQRLAELVAAAAERRGDRRQRRVEVRRRDRGQQRQQVTEYSLRLQRALGAVL